VRLTQAGGEPYTAAEMTLSRRSQRGIRIRQLLLTAALGTPIAFAVAATPPFSADTRAQGASRMLGPRFPALAGGDGIAPTRTGNTITVPSKWSCGSSTNNVFTLSNPEAGTFRTISRTMGLKDQSLTVGSLINGAPREVVLRETSGGIIRHNTDVELRDQNRDGVFDGLSLSGSVSASTSFVFDSNSSYVSIPWAQASALGFKTSGTCAGDVPQVWIPLADTNGDGRGDAVVLDLDGNGIADPDLLKGAPIVATTVPTMGPIGRLALVMLLGLIGTWFLSRRRSDDSGTTAAV
jgi:hypothetical protein